MAHEIQNVILTVGGIITFLAINASPFGKIIQDNWQAAALVGILLIAMNVQMGRMMRMT